MLELSATLNPWLAWCLTDAQRCACAVRAALLGPWRPGPRPGNHGTPVWTRPPGNT